MIVDGEIYNINTQTTAYVSGTYQIYETREGLPIALRAEREMNFPLNTTLLVTGYLRRTSGGSIYLIPQ